MHYEVQEHMGKWREQISVEFPTYFFYASGSDQVVIQTLQDNHSFQPSGSFQVGIEDAFSYITSGLVSFEVGLTDSEHCNLRDPPPAFL